MLHADDIVRNADVGSLACTKAAAGGLFQLLCGWQAAMGIALVTSAALLAFLYIFSVLMRNDGLKNFVKIEISEIFVTVLLVMLLVGMVGAVDRLNIGNLLGPSQIPKGANPGMSIYNLSETYFVVVGQDMSSWLEMNYVLSVVLDSFASVTSQPRPMGVGLVAPPFAGLASPFKQLLYNMSTALAVAFVINYAQLYVYLFALQGSLHYYIPLGIVLRSFTPTRRIGGALIGLGVSFLFFFPALYSLNFGMFYSPDSGPMETFSSFVKKRFDSSAGLGSTITSFFTGKYTGGFVDMVTTLMGDLGRLFSGFLGEIFTLAMVLPISVIGRAFAMGFVMPIFNILLMVQATKFISKSIGEEIDISALTRMV